MSVPLVSIVPLLWLSTFPPVNGISTGRDAHAMRPINLEA